LLVDSLQTREAKNEIFKLSKDTSFDAVMKRLRKRFGRPQAVIPLLIKNFTKPEVFTTMYESLQRLCVQ